MNYALFVVEGPHDEAVLGRLLRVRHLSAISDMSALDVFWHRLVPTKFPHKNDLRARVPVPSFYASEDYNVAVLSAVGIDNIADMVEASLTQLTEGVHGLGIVLDSDDRSVQDAWAKLRARLPARGLSERAGEVRCDSNGMRVGGFVLPDNQRSGTLEAILLECAEVAYPTLLSTARAWIGPLDPHDTNIFSSPDERKDLKKPSGKDKAIVGVIANVLRPGKSVQVSLQDNRWLRDPECLQLPKVAALLNFVDAVIGVTSPTSPTAPTAR